MKLEWLLYLFVIVGAIFDSSDNSALAFSLTRPCQQIVMAKVSLSSSSSSSLCSNLPSHDEQPNSLSTTRRHVLESVLAVGTGVIFADAAPALAKTISPEKAFDNLIQGREELITAAKKYLANRDFEGMREYLQDPERQINQYESNAQILLTSKRLDVESKKAIGTIRRYGVGADVLIMYGGLRAEIDNPDSSPNMNEVQKYLVRTLDSLEEVIVICRSNGLGENGYPLP